MLQGHLERSLSHADPMQVLGAHNMLAGSLLAILFVCTGFFSGTAEGKLTEKPSRHIHEYIYIYISTYLYMHAHVQVCEPCPFFLSFFTGYPPFQPPYRPPTSPLSVLLPLHLSISLSIHLSHSLHHIFARQPTCCRQPCGGRGSAPPPSTSVQTRPVSSTALAASTPQSTPGIPLAETSSTTASWQPPPSPRDSILGAISCVKLFRW